MIMIIKCWGAVLLVLLARLQHISSSDSHISTTKKLLSPEFREEEKAAAAKYETVRLQGPDESGRPANAASSIYKDSFLKKLRRNILPTRDTDLASLLLPGMPPKLFEEQEEVWIYTDPVKSLKTGIPFDFYDLQGCPSPWIEETRKKRQRKNHLGSLLLGIERKPAPYALHVMKDVPCTPLCLDIIGSEKLRWLRKLVESQYRVHMTLDKLPVLMRDQALHYMARGYPIGVKFPSSYTGLPEDEYILFNHLKFTISYTKADGGVLITGFDVHPVSMAHEISTRILANSTKVTTCNTEQAKTVVNDPATYLALKPPTGKDDLSVVFSYEVEWISSDLAWTDRWDKNLIGSPDAWYWFAIMNFLSTNLFLMGAISTTTIMFRTVRKDIAGYNEIHSLEEREEEIGWKLIHGDVFRPPATHAMTFSVLVGSGAQIGSTLLLVMLCAMLGFLDPMCKDQSWIVVFILHVLSGSVAGWVSARILKLFNVEMWKQSTIVMAVGLPGCFVALFIVQDVLLKKSAGAANAIGVLPLIFLFALWVFVSIPLVLIGSFWGYRSKPLSVPVKPNHISRRIPELPWYASLPCTVLLSGMLSYGSVCNQIFFIMSAVWLHGINCMGSLLIPLLILTATCAEVSVVMTYLQLFAEDHRWWWKSFMNCASAGLYLFVFSLWFLSSKMEVVGIVPVVSYLTYMGIVSICVSLVCGSVGALCSFFFIRKIYGAIKVD